MKTWKEKVSPLLNDLKEHILEHPTLSLTLISASIALPLLFYKYSKPSSKAIPNSSKPSDLSILPTFSNALHNESSPAQEKMTTSLPSLTSSSPGRLPTVLDLSPSPSARRTYSRILRPPTPTRRTPPSTPTTKRTPTRKTPLKIKSRSSSPTLTPTRIAMKTPTRSSNKNWNLVRKQTWSPKTSNDKDIKLATKRGTSPRYQEGQSPYHAILAQKMSSPDKKSKGLNLFKKGAKEITRKQRQKKYQMKGRKEQEQKQEQKQEQNKNRNQEKRNRNNLTNSTQPRLDTGVDKYYKSIATR